MGVREGTTDYYLQKKFNYSHKGAQQEATFITLREPTSEHQDGYWVLQKFVTQANFSAMRMINEMNEEKELVAGTEVRRFHDAVDDIEQESSTNDDMYKMILLAGNVDIEKFMKTFKKMVSTKARKPLALIDGEESVPLNSTLMEKMHPDDLLNLAVRWCGFFIMYEILEGRT